MTASKDELVCFAQLVKARAAQHRNPKLLTFVEIDDAGEEKLQYRGYLELWSNGQALARALHARGLRKGDRVALMMQNHPEYVEAMVACAILGLVFVPVDPRTMGSKLAYMLNSVDCLGVIAGQYCAGQLHDVSGEIGCVRFIWLLGGKKEMSFPQELSFLSEALCNTGNDLEIVSNLKMPMQLMFTSGTTGDPKAIVGTYERFAASSSRRAELFGILASDRMYTGLSLTHSNALLISLGTCLYSNIPLVISQRFTKSKLWDIVRRHDCTTLNLLGGMFTAIHAEPRSALDAQNPVRLIIGAGMPKQLWSEFQTRFGVDILEFYGTSEGGQCVNRPGEGPVGSIGKPPSYYYIKLMNEDGRECAPGEPGEMVFGNIDGSPVQLEYFNNPEASAKKTAGGLIWTGDVGYCDENGWVYFLNRKGGGIRCNGDFVSPSIIEKELGSHPDVSDVFVYGVPSTNGVAGEKDVVAAIVWAHRALPDPQEIRAYCAARLEKNHIPAFLQSVVRIPKTASEKPLERVLAGEFSRTSSNVISLMTKTALGSSPHLATGASLEPLR